MESVHDAVRMIRKEERSVLADRTMGHILTYIDQDIMQHRFSHGTRTNSLSLRRLIREAPRECRNFRGPGCINNREQPALNS